LLAFKPDFEESKQRWLAFWQQELIDRPVCVVTAARDDCERQPGPPYMAGAREDFGPVIEQVLAMGESTWWGGDAIPCYVPSFGPDQMAAWLGAELNFGEDERTSWAVPCVERWAEAAPLTLDPDNYWWRRTLNFLRALAEALRGKMLISHLDLHSNMDTLLAMQSGAKLCMELVDDPEAIDRAMVQVRALYQPIYQALYEAANMGEHGTLGWVPAYHPERTNTIQCDFAALIGPSHFKRWALPALAEEAAFLGHCVYHLDGPECIVHLDDLCSIKGLDCIQWVHGARNKPFIEWMDLLKQIQAKGKSVWIPCNAEDIKIYHRELKPNQLFYVCGVKSREEGEQVLSWLKDNT
jgi:hypothetical protein